MAIPKFAEVEIRHSGDRLAAFVGGLWLGWVSVVEGGGPGVAVEHPTATVQIALRNCRFVDRSGE